MGLGLFGGGTDVCRFLVREGARVTATDLKTKRELAPSLKPLEGLPITFHLGAHREEDFTQVNLVIVNPAVPSDSPYLELARRSDVTLDTAMNIFFRLCPARIIGVTGTSGKSTTASLIWTILREVNPRAYLGGNIGHKPLLTHLARLKAQDWVVLELSSFQLQALSAIERSPHFAVVTNISPNHLDRHQSLEEYIGAKQAIVRYQGPKDAAFLNYEDPIVSLWGKLAGGETFFFSRINQLDRGAWVENKKIGCRVRKGETVSIPVQDIRLPGLHNLENVLAALGPVVLAGVEASPIRQALRKFRGLPHRLEFVGQERRVRYYNDSKATTPESAITAIRSFERPILIAGGYDKKIPLGKLASEIARNTKAVVLIGQTARTLAKAIARCRTSGNVEICLAKTLEQAVAMARRRALGGDVVLFSPGCASYDMFTNYEERGEVFRKLIKRSDSESGRSSASFRANA